ncbi:hypothetical protein VCHA29O37_460006 [Vibrio chagasii]|nr:hypothetical protein VCHA29O37_460006 [Vibrio chagasii]
MKNTETIDATDCIDLLADNLDKVTGILFTLEGCLSISDTHSAQTPHAVSAALDYVNEIRKGINKLSGEV